MVYEWSGSERAPGQRSQAAGQISWVLWGKKTQAVVVLYKSRISPYTDTYLQLYLESFGVYQVVIYRIAVYYAIRTLV